MPAKRFSLLHSTRVVFALGWSDFTLKYRGSVLGYLWSLLVPLSKFAVILTVLRPFVASDYPMYPLSLLLGIILWDFFSATTIGCMSALREKSDLIQRIAFPRIIIELAAVWTTLIVVSSHLCLFLVIAALSGVMPSPRTLLLLPVLACGTVLSFGVGSLLASFSLRYRDIPHLWTSVLQILFWLTPVAYPASIFVMVLKRQSGMSDFWRTVVTGVITQQPVSVFIETARSMIPGTALPSFASLSYLALLSLAIAVCGAWVFLIRSRKFLEEI